MRSTMEAINHALGSSEYRCQTVSWDDVERGTVGGSLSSLGANITDTRLWERHGQQLYTVRSQNWNEKLGAVSSRHCPHGRRRRGGLAAQTGHACVVSRHRSTRRLLWYEKWRQT